MNTTSETHDFKDGRGPVPAHKHPNGGGWVDETAKVGADTYVGNGASVGNRASVGDGASVGNRASVGDGASVGYGASVGDGASVGYGASVGEKARLYPYCSLPYRHKIEPEAYLMMVLDMGSIVTGYKKLRSKDGPVIATLEIPAEAKRLQAQISAKCRAEYAKVVSLETLDGVAVACAHSQRDKDFEYRVGEIVRPDSYDEDSSSECSHGIHFFTNKSEAEEWSA